MGEILYKLKPGHTITASAARNGVGHIRQVQDETVASRITTSAVTYGPYMLERDFIVQGDVAVTMAEADIAANIPSAAQAAMLDAIPAADQEDSATVWNDEGVLKVSTAGA